ncbi:MAG: type IV pilus modification protein PilV, partial [Pseudomonadales bacterium]
MYTVKKHKQIYQFSNQSGISLIEVLISILLFAIGVMGFSAMQTRAMQESLDHQQRSVALWAANSLVDRMLANNSDDALAQYANSVAGFTSCGDADSGSCAETDGAADSCTPTEMADHGVWEEFCSGDDGVDSNLIQFAATRNSACGRAAGSDITH